MESDGLKRNWLQFSGILINIFLLALVVMLSIQNRELKSRANAEPKEIDEAQYDLLKEGDSARPLDALTLDGSRKRFHFGNPAKKCLMFVFSTKCPGCTKNLINWNDIAGQMVGVSVLGVSVDSIEQTRHYASEQHIAFDLCSIIDKEFGRSYKVRMVPLTILIDEHGKVVKSWLSYLSTRKKKEILDLARAPQSTRE